MAMTAPFHGRQTEFHLSPSIGGVLSASTKIGEIDDISALELSRATVDLLSYGDDDLRKLVGAKDNGSITLTLNWKPGDTLHQDLATSFIDGSSATYAIRWISDTGHAVADFEAYITSYGVTHPKEDKVTCTVELTITGPVIFDLDPLGG